MTSLEGTTHDLEHISAQGAGCELDDSDIEAIDDAIDYLKELKDLSEMVDDFRNHTEAYTYR